MSLLAERGPGPAGGLHVRELRESDRAQLLQLIDADPYVNAVADARVRASRVLGTGASAGTILGVVGPDGTLRAATLDVGNLLPVGGEPQDWAALGACIRTQPRLCSSIVGRAAAVGTLWRHLADGWGPPRMVRESQPMLALDRRWRGDTVPGLRADVRVQVMGMRDVDRYVPAAAAMFEEELGLAPMLGASAGDFRRRIVGLVAGNRALGVVLGDEVVFKADLGTVTTRTCQIQGVWVHPRVRGQGLATAAMAQVLRTALEMAPTASLYVNDFNTPARRLYDRLGMTETAVVSTILF